MKAQLKQRWHSALGKEFVQCLVRRGRSGDGMEITESPFGTVEGSERVDLRGIHLPDEVELRRVTMMNADLTGAAANAAWIERCLFNNVEFDKMLLNNLSDHGNTFERCRFEAVKFSGAVLGYLGSRYTMCDFTGADFRQAAFVRPEFNCCRFDDCTLSGVDFNGSSFINGKFRGELRGVWFRGGFPVPLHAEKYGLPRPNIMANVNFAEARLFDVSFSDQCDLSSIIPPNDGKHLLFDRWKQRLESLLQDVAKWPQASQKAGELFCRTQLVHAQKQHWYLLGLADLVEEFGSEIAIRIWNGLQKA